MRGSIVSFWDGGLVCKILKIGRLFADSLVVVVAVVGTGFITHILYYCFWRDIPNCRFGRLD